MTKMADPISVKLPEQMRSELEALAREHERSLSAEIRLAIRQYLENGAKS